MPLNTNLLRAPAGIEFPDQLARMATVEQIKSAQASQETARINQQAREQELADAAEARSVLNDASARIKAAGGPENTREAIAQMQMHPNKTVREVGAKLKQQLDLVDRQERYFRAHPGKVVVGGMAGPDGQPAPQNNLAPQPGATNALVPDQFRQQLDAERETANRRASYWEMEALDDPKFAPQAKEARDYANKFGEVKAYEPGRLLMGGGASMMTPAAPAASSMLSRLLAERDALPAGDPRRKIYDDEILKQTTHPAPVNVNVSTGKKYSETFAGELAKGDIKLRDSAIAAPDAVANADRVLDVLNKGKFIAGPGAEWKLKAAKGLNIVGVNNDELIANTEQLQKGLATQTLDAIKTSGLGTAQGFTDKDLVFLEKARSGNIEMTPQTLRMAAELSKKAAEATANKWNTRVTQIPKSAVEGTGLSVEPIQVSKKPAASASKAPAGVPQDVWSVMTPEERKLWQK